MMHRSTVVFLLLILVVGLSLFMVQVEASECQVLAAGGDVRPCPPSTGIIPSQREPPPPVVTPTPTTVIVRNHRVFLPIILAEHAPWQPTPTTTATFPPGTGIFGRVTHNNAPAQGVQLLLRRYNGSAWSTAATTQTNANGEYLFSAVPGLGAGEVYYVRYGPNSSDSSRVAYWWAPNITSYSAGTRAPGGDFDVANVPLVSPAHNTSSALPVTFIWQRRPVAADTYRWRLRDLSAPYDEWWSNDLGYGDRFTLASLPNGGQFGKQYGWDVIIFNGPDSEGLSFYYRNITFTGTGSVTPTRTATPTSPPAQQGIYGRVTHNGSAAANVALSLRFYDGSSWTTRATTQTNADGRYSFIGVPGLGSGQQYYVRYGPNTSDSSRLYVWYGPDILSYTAGASQPGGDFDIANVALLSPASGTTSALPVTFIWQRRSITSDSYRWQLFVPSTGDGWVTNLLGYTDRFTLTGLPSGAAYGTQYGWNVLVYSASDSFGVSYYYRTITFQASSGPPEKWPAVMDNAGAERATQSGTADGAVGK